MDGCTIQLEGEEIREIHVLTHSKRPAKQIVRDVHIPVQTDVVLVLRSEDYVYTLALPQFGLKEIAVPTLEFRLDFRPPDAGRFPLLGDQLCGDPHPDLQCGLVVESRDQFLKWLKNR